MATAASACASHYLSAPITNSSISSLLGRASSNTRTYYFTAVISRRTQIRRRSWAGHERTSCSCAEASRTTRIDLRTKSDAHVWEPRKPWGVRQNGQQQLRYLANVPRESEPQEEKKKSPLSTLIPSHENIYTLPNILTFSRLIAAPIVGYLIIHDLHTPALSLFVYAGITDLVDGWVARRWRLQTVVGTVIDPMADKALMTVVTVCLAAKGVLPIPLAILILGRDVLLGLSALYYRYISLPPPRTLARYWDFSLPSAEVRPTTISKINTFLQLGLIGATMGGLAVGGLGETAQAALEVSWWIVGATTVWSGGSYVWGKDAVRIIRNRG